MYFSYDLTDLFDCFTDQTDLCLSMQSDEDALPTFDEEDESADSPALEAEEADLHVQTAQMKLNVVSAINSKENSPLYSDEIIGQPIDDISDLLLKRPNYAGKIAADLNIKDQLFFAQRGKEYALGIGNVRLQFFL